MSFKYFNLLLCLFLSVSIWAQAPQKFKFQAVARDASGVAYTNENLAVRVSLVRDGVSGLIDYAERHEVTTSPLGVFDLEIGSGQALTGQMSNADWGNHPYYLKIDIDPDGGTNYLNLGTSQLLSVPYAIHAGTAGSGGGGGNPTDELQNLIYDPVSQTLTLTNGNSVTLSFPGGGSDNQTLSLTGTTISIENGNAIDLSVLQDGVEDADADPTNEIQTISLNGNTLSLTSGGSVNLPPATDSQILTFNPNTNELTISGGNTITIPSGGTDADADPTNEIQTLSKTGNTVTLSNGGGSFIDEVDDADADATNELQTISLNGNTLSLTSGGSVNLPAGTDSQTLTFNPNTNELTISGGNTITIPSGGTDADADPTNEIQTLSKTGNVVTLSNGGGSFTDEVNDADADSSNEIQSLSFDPNTNALTISGSNTITIPSGGTDADADPTNEIQTLSKTGNVVTLSNGGGSFTDEVNDADADSSNEIQSLSFDPNTNALTISGSNTITIPSGGTDADADPMNEIQTLSKTGNTVTLSNGGGSFTDEVNDADNDPTNEVETWSTLAGIPADIADGDDVNDADADPNNEMQSLSFDPNTNALTISGSNTVTIPSGGTDADADPTNELQTLSKTGNVVTLSNGGGSFTDEVDDADADPSNEIQNLSLNGNTLSLTNGGSVNLPASTDDQTLSFDANTNELSISGGNTVTIPSGGTDADADPTNELQTLSKTGNVVTLSNGGGSFTDEVDDADNDPTNEVETWSTLAGIPADIADGDDVNDADADPSNEIQTLTKTGNTVTLSNGGGSFTDEVNDADNDPANEIQNLSLNGNTLSLSNGGNVDLSSLSGGSSVWTQSGSDAYYNTGKVGIGTDNPQNDLDVQSAGNVKVELLGGDNASYSRMRLAVEDNSTTNPHLEIQTMGSNVQGYILADGTTLPGSASMLSGIGMQKMVTGTLNGPMHLITDSRTRIFVHEDGRIGMGTNDPQRELHITRDGDSRILLEGNADNNSGTSLLMRRTNGFNIEKSLFLGLNPETVLFGYNDGTAAGNTAVLSAGSTIDRMVFNIEDGPMHLMTGGNTRIFAGTNGRIGMGTTDPDTELHIKQPDTRIVMEPANANSTASITMTTTPNVSLGRDLNMTLWPTNATASFSDGTVIGNTATIETGTGVDRLIFNAEDGPMHLMTGGNTRIFTATNGNVGIGGNIAPDETLVVGQNISGSWLNPAITVSNGMDGTIELGGEATNLSIASGSFSGKTVLVATGTEQAGLSDIELKTSGLMVGKNPEESEATLLVNHDNFGLLVQHEDETNNERWEIYHAPNSDDLNLYVNDGIRGIFDYASGNYMATSDARLKTNIQSLGTVLPALRMLQAKRYNYRSTPQREYMGFLAQDLRKVFPNLVQEAENKEGGSTLMVDYAQLSVVALAAIQEQQQTIDAQEATIQEQKQQLESMENRLKRLEALLLKD